MAEPMTPQQFAATVRAKHPGAYDDLSDMDLTQKVLAKYPEYSDMVSVETPKVSWKDNPRDYLQQRAQELNNESMRQHLMALGPESEGRSFVNRAGHNLLSLVPETAAVIDKAAAGLMDWKNAAAVIAGLVDPAIPGAYFGTQAVGDLTGIGGGESSAKRAVQNPTPENVQNALLSGAQLAGAGAGGLAPGAGAALNPRTAVSRFALLGKTPQAAYQSALKPSTTLSEAEKANVVQTGLDYKIPVTSKGLDKLGALIDDVNSKIKAVVDSAPNRPINKFAVASRLQDTANKFKTQVSPTADMNAISDVGNDFLDTAPNPIPAAQAQAMKQGTYRALGDKAYGELKGASIEAQKSLARGLKEELAAQFPELKNLNAADSRLLDLQPVLERAVNRIGNHQLIGIGTPIAAGAVKAVTTSGKLGAVAGIMKAVLDNPNIKSRLAIALNKSGVPYSQAVSRVQNYSAALAQAALRGSSGSPDQSPDQSTQ